MNTKNLWLATVQSAWDFAEGPLYDRRVKPRNRQLERRLERDGLRDRLATITTNPFYDFLRNEYFPWKFTDQYLGKQQSYLAKHKSLGQMDRLERVRRRLVNRNGLDAEAMIEMVLGQNGGIHGLGVAGATGLLALTYPEEFGCVDKMVVREFNAVGLFLEVNSGAIRVKDAAAMIAAMNKKARELNKAFGNINKWTPRTVDRALWAQRGNSLNG